MAPIAVESKLIIQDLWRKQIDWEIKLQDDLKLRWMKWKQTLQFLENIKIPRWYRFLNTSLGKCNYIYLLTCYNMFTEQ